MFVSVAVDPGGEDSEKAVSGLLIRYGFTEVQKKLFESTHVNDKLLARLKLDLDRATDFYDNIRIYQYPIEKEMVITSLNENRWRRVVIKETNDKKKKRK